MLLPIFLPFLQAQAPMPVAPTPAATAQTYFSQGLQAYQQGRLADLYLAQQAWEKALALWQQQNNRNQEIVTRNFLCLLYDNLGQYPAALDCYQRLLNLTQAEGDRHTEASTLTAMARLQSRLGNYQTALETLQHSRQLWQELGFRTGEVSALNETALVYFNLGDWVPAQQAYEQALAIAEKLGNLALTATIDQNLAQVALESGQIDRAFRLTLRANGQWDALLQQWGDRASLEIKRGKAASLNNLAFLYVQQNQLPLAQRSYQQALQHWQAMGDRPGEASTLNNLGYTYFRQNRLDSAQDYYQQALALRQRIGDRPKEAISRYSLAVLEQKKGNLKLALEQIEQGLTIIEDLRSNLRNQDLRTAFLASKQDYYQLYIDLLMQLHRQQPNHAWDAQALAASERAKARSLLELLATTPGQLTTGIPPELLAQKTALQQHLDHLEEQRLQLFIGNQYQPEKQVALDTEIQTTLEQYRQVLASIRLASPRYGELTQPKTLSLKEIQALLEPDTALLEYALGPQRSYLWVITNRSLQSYELPSAAEIAQSVKTFRDSFLQPTQRLRRYLALEQGQYLRQQVLPFQPSHRRLVIVADGALQYLPFGALISSGATPDVAPRSLVDQYEFVSLPSASVLGQLRQDLARRTPAPLGLAIFADPVFSPEDERLRNTGAAISLALSPDLARSARDSGVLFNRLPYTQTEARQILALLPGQPNLPELGFAANRSRLISQQVSQYRYLHFATHGLLNSENPQLSGLVLSLFNPEGQSINGFLRLYDIFNLQLPAELVVLSACETGLGQEVRGEGLIGLTRGFMYAGAARVVVSLWSVDDQATALLMTQFYQGLLDQKLSPARALQQAQQALKQNPQFASPYYWAGFTLQGEWKN
ncbi:CHAT domain-containing tetratricopeptide repeat protein [Synechocystis sp. LKSZ1]|uniref:CHAT domain-containing tetratricopeptide repeat protein n=1 Tax=Synechocystis sp. LKSZ1 TaxID=3144951 RepID=UPI00336BC4A3